jgi:hypothetical protein
VLHRIPRLPSERTRRLRVALAHAISGGDDVPDFSVRDHGTDTSGRPILMTEFMAAWWEAIVADLGFRPTIVQGAFMSRLGGGASASAGYHDAGGCLDLRTWDLTDTQQQAVIRATRWGGAGSWIRDAKHGGMDPHIHLVLGSDAPLAPGASWQWLAYLNGGDGLSGGGRDYHPRPTPLVTEPPASLMEEAMKPEDWDRLQKIVDGAADRAVKRLLATELGNGVTVQQNLRRAGDTKALAVEIAAEMNRPGGKTKK